jgi:hypothetical protein
MNQRVFESGDSCGKGLTETFADHVVGDITYVDTPGLYDAKMKHKAAEQISEAFKRHGTFRIFFVVTLEGGRVKPEDLTMMNTVCDSIRLPDYQLHYGIIVNKLPKNTCATLRNTNSYGHKSVCNFLNDTADSTRLPTPHIHYLPKVDVEDNQLLNVETEFRMFIHKLPCVHITPDLVGNINANEYAYKLNNTFRNEIIQSNEDKLRAEEQQRLMAKKSTKSKSGCVLS